MGENGAIVHPSMEIKVLTFVFWRLTLTSGFSCRVTGNVVDDVDVPAAAADIDVECLTAELSDISDKDFCFSDPAIEPPKKNPDPGTLPGGDRDFLTALVIQK